MLPSTFSQQLLQLCPPVLVAVGILAGVLLLATIGVAQWLLLRRHIARSGGWVLANALAWIAGLAVVFAAIAVAPPDAPVLTAVFGVAGGLGMGFTVALVTGGVTGNVCPVAGLRAGRRHASWRTRSGSLVGVAGQPIPQLWCGQPEPGGLTTSGAC
jgi:hypothetical protein